MAWHGTAECCRACLEALPAFVAPTIQARSVGPQCSAGRGKRLRLGARLTYAPTYLPFCVP